MRRSVRIWLLACTAALLATAPAQARNLRDAFLWERVSSVDEFVAQVEANPVIAQRFAKHFRVSQAEFINYLRENVVVVQVPETRKYTIYGVTKTGRIYPVKGVLKKGWQALGLRDGTLLFKWSCGNPLGTALPAIPPPRPMGGPLPPPRPTVAAPAEPVVLALADPMLPPYAPDAEGIVWDTPGPMRVVEAPLVPVAVAKSLPLWPLVGLLGVRGGGEPPPPPIPEPGTVLLLAAGLGTLAGWGLRRGRRQ